MHALLFTDLDGTLLDGHAADPGIAARLSAAASHCRVVIATSRTVEEVAQLTRRWDWKGDVIAENGAVVAVADLRMAVAIAGPGIRVTPRAGRWEAVLGADRGEVRRRFDQALRKSGTGLGPVVHAARRQASLLIRAGAIPPTAEGAAFVEALRAQKLRAVPGGEWTAVWSGPNKGESARRYIAAARGTSRTGWLTAAIGNAPNDVSLLQAVDRGFVIRNRVRGPDPALRDLPNCEVLEAAGPAGWAEALEKLDRHLS